MNRTLINLHKSALEYLDQTKGLVSLRQRCELYRIRAQKAFHFEIHVDPSDLIDFDCYLGNLVLNHVSTANMIFQEVLFTAIQGLELLPLCLSRNQVFVCLRLRALPCLPGYDLQGCGSFTEFSNTQRFLQFEGTVCAISTPQKYTRSARYLCPDERCAGAAEHRYIRLHIPGAREKQTIRKNFACSVCGAYLVEDVTCRELGDKLTIEMIDMDVFPELRRRQQTLAAVLRDDLMHGIHIGGQYKFIGHIIHDLESENVFMEVNNIHSLQPLGHTSGLKSDVLQQLPEAIQQIYQDRCRSPWSFALSLAYAFGGCVSPCGTYIHAKLGILLSLVGILATKQESRTLDLLLIGRDNLVLDRLLRYSASFATNWIVDSVGSHLTAATGKRRQGPTASTIEGGSLLLAGGGICLLTDFNSFKKSTTQVLQQAMESGGVFVADAGTDHGAAAMRKSFLPMSCHVWAQLAPQLLKQEQNLDDVAQRIEISDSSKELASMFSMVYNADMPLESYADHLSTHHTFLPSVGAEPVPIISDQNFRKLLDIARMQNPKFLPVAENLIKAFYIASRRVRPTDTKFTVIPQTAIKTITSLARSHAQLNLRSLVTEEDAVVAILLYEESVHFVYGHSVLHIRPLQHIADNDLQNYIGQKRDMYISLFHQQLKNFIEMHAQEHAYLEE